MRYAISLLPVLIFLVTLVLLDTFRLVRPRSVLVAIVAGGLAALIAYFLIPVLATVAPSQPAVATMYIGPVLEEILKAAYVVFLLRTHRVGFLTDAAICGFAVGAGFAVVENLFYLSIGTADSAAVWVFRGCGTAAMQGSATALFGMVASSRAEKRDPLHPAVVLPGLVLAIAVHGLYNRAVELPIVAAALVTLAVPLLMIVVFRRGEQRLRRWLAVGFDTDAAFLQMLATGNLTATPAGQYVNSLKKILPAEIVVDMLCMLRIHVELSLLAKGVLMMRGAGYEVPARPEIADQLAELEHLKRSLGGVGWLTLRPLLSRDPRELWQLTVLNGH